jgi:choline dehydrogenase-like flavoprotein
MAGESPRRSTAREQRRQPMARFRPDDDVDFVVVGVGSAGGIVVRELATRGFRVVGLEQGPWRTERDLSHDEIAIFRDHLYSSDPRRQPTSYRPTDRDRARRQPMFFYARMVGGGSAHWTGNAWRFHEIDFVEASRKGTLAGTGLADWPITYRDLEPYYTRAEWELGVSGAPGPFDPPRSRPFPLPPHPPKSTGALLEIGARQIGWHAQPAPMALLSAPWKGRSPCVHCGACMGYLCEVKAKGSTLYTTIPDAVATGRCEIRPNSYARRIAHDPAGRVTGVAYFDAEKREVFQRARAVVVCCNGAETPRLLLLSRSSLFPQGLANSSGLVGRNLMFNGGVGVFGLFERAVNGYRGVPVTRIVHDPYELDPTLGLYGGGGFDFRFDYTPTAFALSGLPPDVPRWGPAYKRALGDYFNRVVIAFGHTSSLPVPTNRIDLDPDLRDDWGLPAARVTFREHANDLALYRYFEARGTDLLGAAGAKKTWLAWSQGEEALPMQPHLLGTCRMGTDPSRSVVNPDHRTHDVRNLFLVDGSSFVTGGRGQPTLTIMALAFRAGERIARLARAREI